MKEWITNSAPKIRTVDPFYIEISVGEWDSNDDFLNRLEIKRKFWMDKKIPIQHSFQKHQWYLSKLIWFMKQTYLIANLNATSTKIKIDHGYYAAWEMYLYFSILYKLRDQCCVIVNQVSWINFSNKPLLPPPQWRNVTLCRPPADCNLPPLSGAGSLRSPKFVRRDTILFSSNLS